MGPCAEEGHLTQQASAGKAALGSPWADACTQILHITSRGGAQISFSQASLHPVPWVLHRPSLTSRLFFLPLTLLIPLVRHTIVHILGLCLNSSPEKSLMLNPVPCWCPQMSSVTQSCDARHLLITTTSNSAIMLVKLPVPPPYPKIHEQSGITSFLSQIASMAYSTIPSNLRNICVSRMGIWLKGPSYR